MSVLSKVLLNVVVKSNGIGYPSGYPCLGLCKLLRYIGLGVDRALGYPSYPSFVESFCVLCGWCRDRAVVTLLLGPVTLVGVFVSPWENASYEKVTQVTLFPMFFKTLYAHIPTPLYSVYILFIYRRVTRVTRVTTLMESRVFGYPSGRPPRVTHEKGN